MRFANRAYILTTTMTIRAHRRQSALWVLAQWPATAGHKDSVRGARTFTGLTNFAILIAIALSSIASCSTKEGVPTTTETEDSGRHWSGSILMSWSYRSNG